MLFRSFLIHLLFEKNGSDFKWEKGEIVKKKD